MRRFEFTYVAAHPHPHHRSEDSALRHENQRNTNSAMGWVDRPTRFLCLGVDCSLHSHVFTLAVDCLLPSPLSRIYLPEVSSLPWGRLSMHLPSIAPLLPLRVFFIRANERIRNVFFPARLCSVSTLTVHPLVRTIIDDD